MARCPNCGEDNPEGFRFCGFCASPLAGKLEPAREVRKTVTVVFTDVSGSTAIGERLDPESLRRVMNRYFDEMKRVLERHGGTVEKFIGDAVMAVFGIPTLHEDDALRAVRAAAEMQVALAVLNEQLEQERGVRIVTRTGVNTGEVVAGDPAAGQRLVTGDPVNTAARLEQAAAPGEVLLGEPTFRLVRNAVRVEPVAPLSLKGKAEPVPAYHLLEVIEGAAGMARRADSPMVGRDRELRLLADAFHRMASERGCHLVTVLGVAGIGKSRLIGEFLKGAGSTATALQGRCLPYGEGITFWPVAEIVRQAAGIGDSASAEEVRTKVAALLGDDRNAPLVVERVVEVLGIAERVAGSPEELFWGVRKLFEALATERPLVVVVDDVHWAEPTLLDLIEHIADWSSDAPILLVAVARPELLDRRPGWGGGKFNAASLLLEPLTDDECDQLITNLLDGGDLGIPARRRIRDAAEGNPLFVEQTLAMLIDDGLLAHRDGRWVPTGDLSHLSVPPTIQALLAARLDQLMLNERAVMECASVVGKVFYRGAVRELLPETERSDVARHLMTLVRKELIRPDASSLAGEDAFRFRNLLIRDAAYAGLPKETRAELHERFAEWLEDALGERVGEYAEIVGYHMEQAFGYRAELGPVDERGRGLARRAAELLGAAGQAAYVRRDLPAAVSLLSRAVHLLPTHDELRADLQLEAGEALWASGDVDGCLAAVDDSLDAARLLQDERRTAAAEIRRMSFDLNLNPEGWTVRVRPHVERAIAIFERASDDRNLARAWMMIADISNFAGSMDEADRSYERALEHSIRSDDLLLTAGLRVTLAMNALAGATPVEPAITRCEEALEQTRSTRGPFARVLRIEANLQAMRGAFDEARDLIEQGQAILDEIGLKTWNQAENWEFEANVALLVGDPGLAAERYGQAFAWASGKGDKGWGATLAAEAARARCLTGDLEEAGRLIGWAEENGGSDDLMTQLMWPAIRARLLAMQGDFSSGSELIDRAVAAGAGTELISMRADARMDAAVAFRLAGRTGDAAAQAKEALELYEAKGHLVGANEARSLLSGLGN